MKSRIVPPHIFLSFSEFCKEFSDLAAELPQEVRERYASDDCVVISLEGKKIIVDFFQVTKDK